MSDSGIPTVKPSGRSSRQPEDEPPLVHPEPMSSVVSDNNQPPDDGSKNVTSHKRRLPEQKGISLFSYLDLLYEKNLRIKLQCFLP